EDDESGQVIDVVKHAAFQVEIIRDRKRLLDRAFNRQVRHDDEHTTSGDPEWSDADDAGLATSGGDFNNRRNGGLLAEVVTDGQIGLGLRVAQPLIADNPGRSILKVVGEFGQPSL